MEGNEEGVKTKTLAVFQNVVTKQKQRKRKQFRTHRFSDDDSSPSESELVIDEDDEPKEKVFNKRKRSNVRVSLKRETINLECEWDTCNENFSNIDLFYKHIMDHVSDNKESIFECKWELCPNPTPLPEYWMFEQHVTYHGYLEKLKGVGQNVLERDNLPGCHMKQNYTILLRQDGYNCEWDDCTFVFNIFYNFLYHVDCHVNAAPSGRHQEVVPCKWKGCNGKLTSRWKLAEHVKVHTKQKLIACPTCMATFHSKTTFRDHQTRQLSTSLRSYQCSQCLKLFPTERILSDHMRSHINQYKCTMCDMTSKTPSMLAKHFRYKHMAERPFSCTICDKKFVAKHNLNTHLLTHQEKPFKCEQCDFGCKSKKGLKGHMARTHGEEESVYECQVCKLTYKRGQDLTTHLIKKHKFHWPSGHSRFRYLKDSDGVRRLQTVRYESLEVTEQMLNQLKAESANQSKNQTSGGVTYNVTYDQNEAGGYKLTISEEQKDVEIRQIENNEEVDEIKKNEIASRKIIITIEDVDNDGRILKTQVIGSDEIIVSEASQDEESDEEASRNTFLPKGDNVEDVSRSKQDVEIFPIQLEASESQLKNPVEETQLEATTEECILGI